MELINFVGASPSKDGKWLLVTFARKGTNEKFRFIAHYGTGTAYESENKYYVLFPKSKMEEPKEEPKEESKEEPKEEHDTLEEEIPF